MIPHPVASFCARLDPPNCHIVKKKKHVFVSAGVGHFLVKIIAKRLNIPCLNFSELFDCNLSSRHNSNICAPAVAIAHLNRLSQIK